MFLSSILDYGCFSADTGAVYCEYFSVFISIKALCSSTQKTIQIQDSLAKTCSKKKGGVGQKEFKCIMTHLLAKQLEALKGPLNTWKNQDTMRMLKTSIPHRTISNRGWHFQGSPVSIEKFTLSRGSYFSSFHHLQYSQSPHTLPPKSQSIIPQRVIQLSRASLSAWRTLWKGENDTRRTFTSCAYWNGSLDATHVYWVPLYKPLPQIYQIV